MEIGIPRGRFTVMRVFPGMSDQYPDGAFVIRIADQDAGVTVVVSLGTEDGLRLAAGLHTKNDPDQAAAPIVALPTEAETRVLAGGADRRIPIDEEPQPGAEPEAPAAG